jgi:hypothetical protein
MSSNRSESDGPEPASGPSKPKRRKSPSKAGSRKKTASKSSGDRPSTIPRATASFDDEDLLLAGGSSQGYGRCGGRVLGSRLEARICDQLSAEGITHSHAPRHFEVRLDEKKVAAYAPMIVLRGRGREGKTVILEAAEELMPTLFEKIRAFRKQYGLEFYVSFVAPEELLDDVPFDAYDEATPTINLNTLISRLSD